MLPKELMTKKGKIVPKGLRVLTIFFVIFSFMVCLNTTASANPDTVIDTFSGFTGTGSISCQGGFAQIITVPATDTLFKSMVIAVSAGEANGPGTYVNAQLYAWDGAEKRITGSPILQVSAQRSNTKLGNFGPPILDYYLTTFDMGNTELVAGAQYAFLVVSPAFVCIEPTNYIAVLVTDTAYPGGNAFDVPSVNQSDWTTKPWTEMG